MPLTRHRDPADFERELAEMRERNRRQRRERNIRNLPKARAAKVRQKAEASEPHPWRGNALPRMPTPPVRSGKPGRGYGSAYEDELLKELEELSR